MNKQAITVELPSDIFLTLNENENELIQEIKISLSNRMYKLQKLTIGKAAEIAGMSHYDFECLLSENDVPISALTIEDIINDTLKLK